MGVKGVVGIKGVVRSKGWWGSGMGGGGLGVDRVEGGWVGV